MFSFRLCTKYFCANIILPAGMSDERYVDIVLLDFQCDHTFKFVTKELLRIKDWTMYYECVQRYYMFKKTFLLLKKIIPTIV